MSEVKVPRLVGLLQLSKHHRQSWKGIERRSATNLKDSGNVTCLAYSGAMIIGSVLAVCASFFLLVAFSSSYWMESRRHAYSEFVKLGLWEVCFNNYFHHSFQFHYAFSGCHWVYSKEYRLIWEFIMPPWFLAVQGLATVSVLLSLSSLTLLALLYLRVKIKTTSTIITTAAVQNFLVALFLFLAILIFGIQAQSQQWMPHQLYNYYSWSYWTAFVAILFHAASAWVMLKDARKRRILEAILSPTPAQISGHTSI